MATGTGNLPNQDMSFSPFAILTAEEMNDLVENIESLADGSGVGDGAVTNAKLATDSVSTAKVIANAITGVKLSDSSLGDKVFARVAVNGATNTTDKSIAVQCSSGTTSMTSSVAGSSTSERDHISFVNSAEVGKISTSGSSTTYATSSDYRLKEDYKEVENATERLGDIKVRDFKWKASDERQDGFIAHELQEVIPNAVSGEKDAVDKDGNPKHQMIDYAKVVPLLTAALQEANERIAGLEKKII